MSASPTHEKEAQLPGFAPAHASEIVARAEDVQDAYIEQKNRLVSGIDATRTLLSDLRTFNKDSWVVRYPQLAPSQQNEQRPVAPSMRRTLSFADEPGSATEVVIGSSKRGMRRSLTLANISEAQDMHDSVAPTDDSTDVSSEFSVLRLDLKLGPTGSSTSPAALVSQLEKASIANLLDERVVASINHINKLRARVNDTSSKVLVTGDLNAGKSTFVNALLRKQVMPVDQQPCTTLFCEVHDATDNGAIEEVHVVTDGRTYSIKDESTFTRRPISDLESIVTESDAQHILKVYIADARTSDESLLHNGVVDIALIDAPGLNIDSLKTTALFSRQEEIDVVVFVVSAENHFTLSAKEFFWDASNEKQYLFIVVNRFDQIRDKERCRRVVLEQIKQLSPRTWDDAEDLVHFVDSASSVDAGSSSPSFDKLESALRSFVLVKRAKSKLHPAATYLTNLLGDIDLLASANSIVAQSEHDQATEDLDRVRPVLEKMRSGREHLEDGLETIEDECTTSAGARARDIINTALDRIGEGELALALPHRLTMPAYPGVLRLWDYVRDVRRVLLMSMDLAVKFAEDEARTTTSGGVRAVAALGETHLPAGVERSKRIFMPEAMFSPRARPGKARRGAAVVAGGVHGLGIGLAQRTDLLEPSVADVFDVQYYLALHFGGGKDGATSGVVDDDAALSALSVLSVGVGALTMASGKALGARGLLEGIVRGAELLGSPGARRWAAPALGAATLALAAYLVLSLPTAVPRAVGRRVRGALLAEPFAPAHVERIERETRKVLRLAGWDLRERFRGALEERGREVRGAEESRARAERALAWFADVGARTANVREVAALDT